MVTDSSTQDAEQVYEAMEAALAEGRVADFCKLEDRLEDLVLATAWELLAAAEFAASSVQFEAARQLNERLLQALDGLRTDALAGDETTTAVVDDARMRGTRLLPRWTAYRDYAEGMALRLVGRFSEAIDKLQSAAASWQATKNEPEMAATARAQAATCKGLEEMRRANFQRAAAAFMAARPQFDEVAKRFAAEPGDDASDVAARVRLDALGCEMLYETAASRSSLFNGNLDAAIKHAEACSAAAQRIIDERPADIPAWVAAAGISDLHIGEAWHQLALAERHRRDSRWAEAITAYTNAQEKFERAAAVYVSTGLPQAEASQEQTLNQAAQLNMQIRQTEDQRDSEKKLLEQIASLKDAIERRDDDVDDLIRAMRNQGVKVNNVAEATAQVDVNLQIVQQVENHVHEQLGDLRRAVVADDSLDSATKEKLAATVDEALAGDQHGPGFRERAGRIVEQLGAITKAAGIVAGPIPVMIGTLMSLAGRWAKGG